MYIYTPITNRLATLDRLYPLLKERAYIAGSYVVACLDNQDRFSPSDIDVFVLPNQMESLIQELTPVFGSFSEVWTNIYRSDNLVDARHIQLIDRGYENPRDIITSFDWSCCSAAIVGENTILAHKDVLDRKGRALRLSNLAKSFKRLLKYSRRGFYFDDDQYELITQLAKGFYNDGENDVTYDWGHYIYINPDLEKYIKPVPSDDTDIPF